MESDVMETEKEYLVESVPNSVKAPYCNSINSIYCVCLLDGISV